MFYLRGDIENSEKEILNKNQKNNVLESTVIKIAHHGAKTSSSEEFLRAVNARIALIGVGKNNRFEHPSDETIERLKKLECKIYRTDLNGEIGIEVNKNGKVLINKTL